MLAVGCVINNIQRRFPEYWWTPVDLRSKVNEDTDRSEKGSKMANGVGFETQIEAGEERIIIDRERIIVPKCLVLGYDERAMLEILFSEAG